MKTCEKCSVDLIHDPGRGGWPREREGATAHIPERCRDRLAARLAEVEREEKDVAEAMVALREACAAVAHKASGDINVGHAVGRVDVLPFYRRGLEALAAISATGGKETGK